MSAGRGIEIKYRIRIKIGIATRRAKSHEDNPRGKST